MARFLALDWDAGQIHLLAATQIKGGVKFDRALSWTEELPPTAATAPGIGQRLKEHLKEAGISPAPLVVAIGRDRVILKEVRYPAVPAHEEPGVVRFQAVKELTDPADEVTIDYQAGDAPEPSGERKALAVAIRKDVLAAYRAIATAAGVKVVAAAPRAFGVIACLQRTANPAPDPGTAFAVLTAGEKGGEFAVARGDFLAFARPLAGTALASDAALLGEIRRNLAVYAGQAPQHPIRALYVAEGDSGTLGIGDRLRDTLAIPVLRFDPLGGEQAPAGATAGSFAGIAGLLQLKGRGKGLPINFVKPREPKPPADPNRRLWTRVAVAAGVLLLIGGGLGYMQVAKLDAQVKDRQTTKNDLDSRLQMLDQDERRIAAVDQWQKSEIVWLDEFYNLTARFPEVRNLRLTEFTAEPLPLPVAQPGKPIDPAKPVALVKLKGLNGDDAPLRTLKAALDTDAARVNPLQTGPNAMGTRRSQFTKQWSETYQLVHDTPIHKPFEAATPERGRNRGRGRGGPDMGADLFNMFLNGGAP